jgi:hypothetical protein
LGRKGLFNVTSLVVSCELIKIYEQYGPYFFIADILGIYRFVADSLELSKCLYPSSLTRKGIFDLQSGMTEKSVLRVEINEIEIVSCTLKNNMNFIID